nr:hypothetical protein [uncultured Pseudomonas sp.]
MRVLKTLGFQWRPHMVAPALNAGFKSMESASQISTLVITILGGLATVLTFVLQFAKASEVERAKVFSWTSKALWILFMLAVIGWFSWKTLEYALTPGQPTRWETAMFAINIFNVLMYSRFLFEAVLNMTVRKDAKRHREENEKLQQDLVAAIARNEARDKVREMLGASTLSAPAAEEEKGN